MLILERHTKHRTGAIAGATIPFRVETDVLVGVFEIQTLARLRDAAGQPFANLESNLDRVFALCDFGPEFVGVLVQQVERGTIGLHHLADAIEDHLQQFVEIEGRPEQNADLLQRAQLGALALDLLPKTLEALRRRLDGVRAFRGVHPAIVLAAAKRLQPLPVCLCS